MASLNSLIEDTFKILVSSTVVAGILGLVAKAFFEKQIQNWLMRAKADLDKELESHKARLQESMESHKWRIRRQELFFEREIEAAEEIQKLCDHVLPTYDHPDMDFQDACEHVYQCFGDTADRIGKYLSKYRVFIEPEIVRELEDIGSKAERAKFNYELEAKIPEGTDLELVKKILSDLPSLQDRVFLHLRSKIYDA